MAQDEREGRIGGYKSGVRKVDRNNTLYWASCEKTPAVTHDDEYTFEFLKRRYSTYTKVYFKGKLKDTFKIEDDEKEIIDNLNDDDDVKIEIVVQRPIGRIIHLFINKKLVYAYHTHKGKFPKFIVNFFRKELNQSRIVQG